MLKQYYLSDEREMCVAFSGGKDSTAVLYLTCTMLLNLKRENQPLKKKIYVINSNTLAELPPLLKYLENTLEKIRNFATQNNLPLHVEEVFPEEKDTLNVQLLGVGLPPPSATFRWCTDKLKINPIDRKVKEFFEDGKFISVIGTRKDESFDRSARIEKATVRGTDLKINNRYENASNLMPIEDWSTKDVWEYLFKQDNSLADVMFLWKLYSDASSKNATECSFVAAGGNQIDNGNIGCGVSRFGCWQCYMVRDKDRSLDGLMESGYENMHLYKEYRDWYWNLTQQGWDKTRDVYSHRTQGKELYNKGGEESPKYGMVMPKGMTLKVRKKSFKKLLELQDKLDNETIITIPEILLIQERWLDEGDIELTAFKYARKHSINIEINKKVRVLRSTAKEAKKYYREELFKKPFSKNFAVLTLKRFAVQYTKNEKNIKKIEKKFFPSKEEEKHLRKEWKKQKKIKPNVNFRSLLRTLMDQESLERMR